MTITVGPQGNAVDVSTAVGSFTGTKTLFENLNKAKSDRSTIVMSSDQQITFDHQRGSWKHLKQIFSKPQKFSTDGADAQARGAKAYGEQTKTATYENPQQGTGFAPVPSYPASPTSPAVSQIILTSDRIVIDSRADSVLISAMRDVKIGTKNWRMETDSTMSVIHEGIKQTLILTQHVQEVAKQLDDTLAILEKIQFPTGVGPTGPCLDTYFSEIKEVRKTLTATRDSSVKRSDQFQILSDEFIKQKRSPKDQKKVF